MDGAIVTVGKYTQGATAQNLYVKIVQGCDWMSVLNYTQAATQQATGRGIKFEWQIGMAQGTGIEYKKTNTTDALNMVTMTSPAGFSLVDTSVNNPGALNNGSTGVSAVSNAAIPVATVGSTAGLAAGAIVRLYNIASARQLGGIDFTIGYNTFTGTTFDLSYMTQLAVAGTTGSWRVIPYNPIYYPRYRFITSITSSGSSSVVVTSVTHGYQVGQSVRFIVPAAYGMVEMNELQGTITAVNTSTTVNSFTVDIDSSAFTAFAFPLSAAVPFSPAVVVPIGEDEAFALSAGVSDLTDRTFNTAFVGMLLPAGAQSPGGSANDVLYWQAGKAFSSDLTGSSVLTASQV